MAISNAAGISVPNSAIEQLETLLRHIDRSAEIVEKSQKSKYGITIFQVLRPLAKELDIPYSDLEEIFFALENLKHMETEFGSVDEAFARIEVSVSPDLAKKLRKNKAQISTIL